MLYDQFGREIAARDTRRPDTREICAVQVRDRWSTYPSSGLTPVKLARIFREADNGDVLRQAELFEEMEEKDGHLSSQFQVRKLAIQGLGYEILPVSEDAESKKIADFCREAIESLDLDDHILDLLDALPKGYSMMEILWDASAGQNWIRSLRWVHPKKITFWNSVHPRIFTEDDPVHGIDPPPFKFIYHRYKARSGYDTRAGILRVCAWMYLFKNYAVKDWASFAEVYGMPLRLGKYEPGATSEDRNALLSALQSLGSDAAGIISKNTEIEFVEAQKTSTLNIFESLVNFCDSQMSKAILGQTLTSEAGGSKGQGSYALGRVHADVRQDLVEADAKALGKTMTQQILRPLVGFNFGWDVPVPLFRLLYEPPEDLKESAGIYKTLGDIGLDYSQEHVSDRFKVPLRKPDETPMLTRRIDDSQNPENPADENPKTIEAKNQRHAGAVPRRSPQFDADQNAVEDLADQMLASGNSPITGMDRRIAAIVMRAESFEDMMTQLYASFKDQEPDTFVELMRRAIFAADLWGDLTARRNP